MSCWHQCQSLQGNIRWGMPSQTDGQMDRWIDVQYALVQGPVGSHLPTLLPSHPYVPTTPGWVTMGDGLTLFVLS